MSMTIDEFRDIAYSNCKNEYEKSVVDKFVKDRKIAHSLEDNTRTIFPVYFEDYKDITALESWNIDFYIETGLKFDI